MYAFRKILSVILLLVIAPLISAAITLQTGRALLRDPASIKRAVRAAGLYAAVEQSITQSVLKAPPKDLPLPPQEYARVVAEVLPARQVEQLSEQVIDGFHAWFWGDSPEPVLMLDLTELRRSLPPALQSALRAHLESLPACATGQMSQFSVSSAKSLPSCRAADSQLNQRMAVTIVQNLNLESLVPERYDLAAAMAGSQGDAFWQEAWTGVGVVKRILGMILWGWALATLLLLALLLLNLERWYTPYAWVGTAAVFGSALPLLAGLGGGALARVVSASSAGDAGDEVAAAVVRELLATISGAMRTLSLPVLLLGLAAIAVSVYGKVNDRPAPPANI